MGEQARTKVTKKELELSQDMWVTFTAWMKNSTIAVIAVLVLLAILFL